MSFRVMMPLNMYIRSWLSLEDFLRPFTYRGRVKPMIFDSCSMCIVCVCVYNVFCTHIEFIERQELVELCNRVSLRSTVYPTIFAILPFGFGMSMHRIRREMRIYIERHERSMVKIAIDIALACEIYSLVLSPSFRIQYPIFHLYASSSLSLLVSVCSMVLLLLYVV